MLLRVLAQADVADRSGYEDSLSALQRAEHDLDGKLASILAQAGEFDSGANLLCQRFSRSADSVGNQPFRKALWNDALYMLPREFVAVVSELLLRLNVEQNNLPALVYHHHRVRSCLEQSPVPVLRPRQIFLRLLDLTDVGVCAEPAKYLSLRIKDWNGPGKERAVQTIFAAKGKCVFPNLARL